MLILSEKLSKKHHNSLFTLRLSSKWIILITELNMSSGTPLYLILILKSYTKYLYIKVYSAKMPNSHPESTPIHANSVLKMLKTKPAMQMENTVLTYPRVSYQRK